ADLAAENDLMPVLFLTGAPADRLVLTKPETCSLYLMDLRLGTPEERAAAAAAQEKNRQIVAAVEAEWRNEKKYGQWDDKYVAEFVADLEVSEPAKALIANKMKAMSAERRAGRKRNYSWLQPTLESFKSALFEEKRPLIEKAAALQVRRHIPLPAMVCDAKVDSALQTAYVGLWDETVRAYDLRAARSVGRSQ
ncbi:MAG: hypothetical protein N3A66_07075, partial [Planctomycetota bacterium]|nr:hypothetical protein [Planctomycetota bacterium]